MILLKYKGGYDRDIDALENDSLWVTNIYEMNDPMDLGFYINPERVVIDDRVLIFQKSICENLPVISFSTVIKNYRLWNYYTNGLKGMALAYYKSDIDQALKSIDCSFHSSKIRYINESQELTNFYLNFINDKKTETLFPINMLFTKNSTWAAEKEYRYSLSSKFLFNDTGEKVKGKLLEGIIPYRIYIGYKMDKKSKERIMSYCKKKNVKLYVVSPDFTTKNPLDMKIVELEVFNDE